MNRKDFEIKWTSNFAYAVGLFVTDGCLSSDGRHLDFTSKDSEQIENFLNSLGISCKIGIKKSGLGYSSFRVQFSNVHLYRFMESIGLSPNKSKTISVVDIPEDYIPDFLRGHFDGDGSFYTYFDKRWKNSKMFYMSFASASKSHILWLRKIIDTNFGVRGSLSKPKNGSTYQLKYAKSASVELYSKLYYNNEVVCLSRKRQKIEAVLAQKE